MKILQKLILSVFILCSIGVFAQENEETKPQVKKVAEYPKNEIRIIAENFFGNKNYDYSYYSNSGIYYSYFDNTSSYFNNRFRYGLGYNLNFHQIGLRAKVFYNNYDESSKDSRNAISKTTSSVFRVSVGVNYQKHLKKVVLFSGADLGYFSVDFNYSLNTNIQNYSISDNKIKYSGLSIQPLVGFKYFFNENFSISSEIRFMINKYSGDSEFTTVDYNGNATTSNSSFDGTSYQLGPLGSISLNVHF